MDDDNSASDIEHREQRRRGRAGSDHKNPSPIKMNGSPSRNKGSSLTSAPHSPPSSRAKTRQQSPSGASPSAAAAAAAALSSSMSKYHSSSGGIYEEERENHYHRELVMYGSRSVINPLDQSLTPALPPPPLIYVSLLPSSHIT